MSELILDRRGLLGASLVAAGGALLPFRTLFAGDLTPPQVEGPFHPTRGPIDYRLLHALDKNADLTRVNGQTKSAVGQLVHVLGTVTDEKDVPLAGVEVEIWQACSTGRYNHRNDPNSAAWLDPSFQYWGFAKTDSDGRYAFKTILPGAYRNDPTWIRPPHIHYKVRRPNRPELTTQLYFSGTTFTLEGKTYSQATLRKLNELDQVLAMVPLAERPRVIAPLLDPAPGHPLEPGSKICTFDIVLPKS
jgi:protocatechuate 3,4-dioxygenase beta subunit